MSAIERIAVTADSATTHRRPDASAFQDWRDGLPARAGSSFVLREPTFEDAPMLLAALTAEDVARFIDRGPDKVEGFQHLIISAHQAREAGCGACFAIVPDGMQSAVGLIHLYAMQPDFGIAQWSFAVASSEWGTGMFIEAAHAVVDFAVDVLGTYRLEARATVSNGRGNGALRKIGAVQEAILRCGFERDGVRHDQVLWSIADSDWRLQRLAQRPTRLVS